MDSTKYYCLFYPLNCELSGDNCQTNCNFFKEKSELIDNCRKKGIFDNLKLDFEKINSDLYKLTITEKLDYWLKIHDKYIKEPNQKCEVEKEKFDTKKLMYNSDRLLELEIRWILFGDTTFYRSIIPKSIYIEHFKDVENTQEFTYWFLIYDAKQLYESYFKCNFKDKIKSQLAKEYIQAEIKQMNEFETKAKELILNKIVDIEKENYQNLKIYEKEIEYLRIIDKYYEKHILQSFATMPIYAKHIFFKDYLQSEYDKLIASTPENKELIIDNSLNEKLELIDILKRTSDWNYLKNELANKQLIDFNTGVYKDEKKGNISLFIALLKHLHSKGYYTNKPTNKEIVIILKNTFGINTKENTCKHTKGTDFEKEFHSIKYANEIK